VERRRKACSLSFYREPAGLKGVVAEGGRNTVNVEGETWQIPRTFIKGRGRRGDVRRRRRSQTSSPRTMDIKTRP